MKKELMNLRFGGNTVEENIAKAVANGKLLALSDGRWTEPEFPLLSTSTFIHGGPVTENPCATSVPLLFQGAYAKSAVPYACRNCYKVKVEAKTLRELVAVKKIVETFNVTHKCGPEVDHKYTSNLYGAIIYLDGLDAALRLKEVVRELVSRNPLLGPDIPVYVKRGCTFFELACGPSDQYTFPQKLQELEAQLFPRFIPAKRPAYLPAAITFATWIATAYRIGDETYLDFTGGKRYYPKLVKY
jgi:hypothetical protein